LEGVGRGLFQGSIPEIAWNEWGKSWVWSRCLQNTTVEHWQLQQP